MTIYEETCTPKGVRDVYVTPKNKGVSDHIRTKFNAINVIGNLYAIKSSTLQGGKVCRH